MTRFTHASNTVEANKFSGPDHNVNAMMHWVASFGGESRVTADSFIPRVFMDIRVEGQELRIFEGEWLVRHTNHFEVVPDLVFKDMYTEYLEPVEEKQSNLVDHAKRELEIIGEEPAVVEAYLKIVRIFADMGHSGASSMFAIPVIEHLLSFKPLSELTDDPEDWIHVGADIWGEKGGIYQNRRNGEAFSKDGGKTYYLLSDGSNSKVQRQMHTSKKVEK